MTAALCQCVGCLKYLARNRAADGPQLCVECAPGRGILLAKIRGTLTDPLSLECLALISEECAEVIQRKEKIGRWGWDADFEGSTQRSKLETELGDVLANTVLAAHNDQVSLVNVLAAAEAKLDKYREDRRGPQQRLLHASPPVDSAQLRLAVAALTSMDVENRGAFLDWFGSEWCRSCSGEKPCYCECDE